MQEKNTLKTIVCDFDGTITNYRGGWTGIGTVDAEPCPGAMLWLATSSKTFKLEIFGARSRSWRGRRAMRRFVRKHMAAWVDENFAKAEAKLRAQARPGEAFTTPAPDVRSRDLKNIMARLSFPKRLGPYSVMLNDRAIAFNGSWPRIRDLRTFKPWTEAPDVGAPVGALGR